VRAEIIHERVVVGTNQHQPQFFVPIGPTGSHREPSDGGAV